MQRVLLIFFMIFFARAILASSWECRFPMVGQVDFEYVKPDNWKPRYPGAEWWPYLSQQCNTLKSLEKAAFYPRFILRFDQYYSNQEVLGKSEIPCDEVLLKIEEDFQGGSAVQQFAYKAQFSVYANGVRHPEFKVHTLKRVGGVSDSNGTWSFSYAPSRRSGTDVEVFILQIQPAGQAVISWEVAPEPEIARSGARIPERLWVAPQKVECQKK